MKNFTKFLLITLISFCFCLSIDSNLLDQEINEFYEKNLTGRFLRACESKNFFKHLIKEALNESNTIFIKEGDAKIFFNVQAGNIIFEMTSYKIKTPLQKMLGFCIQNLNKLNKNLFLFLSAAEFIILHYPELQKTNNASSKEHPISQLNDICTHLKKEQIAKLCKKKIINLAHLIAENEISNPLSANENFIYFKLSRIIENLKREDPQRLRYENIGKTILDEKTIDQKLEVVLSKMPPYFLDEGNFYMIGLEKFLIKFYKSQVENLENCYLSPEEVSLQSPFEIPKKIFLTALLEIIKYEPDPIKKLETCLKISSPDEFLCALITNNFRISVDKKIISFVLKILRKIQAQTQQD